MKKSSSRPATSPAGRKGVSAKKKPTKKPRAKITLDPPQTLRVDDDDAAAIALVAERELASRGSRARGKRSAVDRLEDPKPAGSQSELIARVSTAIERELSRIEVIVGGAHVPPLLRTEAESRARVLASLARTLKEVMRLREQAQGKEAEADDDAVPRDLGELRSELARRLEILVGEAKTLHPDAAE
jgi:hypothetical protein